VPYAKVYLAFNGPSGDEDPAAKGYLSFDGLHPNDTGHRVIAGKLRLLGYAPLR
jgi:lysophospholipase L1-like esterase